MLDIDVNAMIWGISMSATMKAAVHLGYDYQENLRATKNTDIEKVKPLFDISQKKVPNQSGETVGISDMSNEPPRGELRDSPSDDHRVSVDSFSDHRCIWCIVL